MIPYPKWWETTVTIYNKYVDPITDVITWNRHYVTGCFWKDVSYSFSIGNTTLDANTLVCRIPKLNNYLSKDKWVDIPNDKMSSYITLGIGDIIIPGEISDEIDEYTSGKRSSDIVAKYKELQGCLQIKTVGDNTGVERGIPHYYVGGQ